jgi:RNA polymerase sigma-70 factor (ECF subfamily)
MSSLDNEIQLTAALINGELSAFDALYELYHHAVYANIIKYVGRSDVAEDILQDVFFALWAHRHTLESRQTAGGWLFTVSHNKSLLYLREALSEKKFLAALPVLPAGEEAVDEVVYQYRMDILRDAIEVLPPTKKEVFQLCRLEGKSYNEAANLLNISPALVKESLRSASQLIRKYISSKHPAIQLTTLVFLLSRHIH